MAHLQKYCETSNLAEPERLHLRILYDKTEYWNLCVTHGVQEVQ